MNERGTGKKGQEVDILRQKKTIGGEGGEPKSGKQRRQFDGDKGKL